jgi:hypothetical protein
VFIGADKILLQKGLLLIEVDLSTNEQKIIETPKNWTVNADYRRLKYDMATNSVHMIYREKGIRGYLYYILHLDDYSWEVIDELGFILHDDYWYDSMNKHKYVFQNIKKELYPEKSETDPELIFSIVKFDVAKREFLEYVEMPRGIYNIYCMYGSPLKILADIRNDKDNYRHLFIFNTETKEMTDFPEIATGINAEFSRITYPTPLKEGRHFIGVMRSGYESRLVMMNLNANTMETVALHDFPYEIYNFKQITEGKYSFMVATRTWAGGHGISFLCFLDYP